MKIHDITYGATDTVEGGSGNDTIVAVSGDELIDGGADDDLIYANGGDDTITGGTGDDSIEGGGGNDSFIYNVGDGNDTIADFNVGNSGTLDDGDSSNNDFIDLSAYYDYISELYADQADDGILNQSNTTDARGQSTDYSDNAQFGSGSLRMSGASADSSSFTEENTGVTCFTAGTAIRTPSGDVLIETLRVGDLVDIADNGPQPIRWIGTRKLDHRALAGAPDLRLILVQAEALGNARPLLVSPQRCMMLGGNTLVRAKHLAGHMRGVCYAHPRDAHRVGHSSCSWHTK